MPIRAPRRSGARRESADLRLGVPPRQREFFGDQASAAKPLRPRSHASRSSARHRRDRHRAVLRGRAAALRGPVGRRALSRGAIAHRASPEALHPVTREIIVGGARPTRRRRIQGLLPARRSCAACATLVRSSMRWWCRRRRPPTRSTRSRPIPSSSTAGSAPTPTSSTCSTCARSPCRPHSPATACRSASRCSPRRAATRCSPARPRFHARSGLPLGATRRRSRRCARLPLRRSAGEIAHRRGRRASLRHAAQPRAARARRALSGGATAPDYRAVRAAGTTPPKPGLLRVAAGAGRARSRWRSGRCRRRPSAASSPPSPRRCDRHARARGRPRGEGLSGRGRARRRRARHLDFGGWRAYMAQS